MRLLAILFALATSAAAQHQVGPFPPGTGADSDISTIVCSDATELTNAVNELPDGGFIGCQIYLVPGDYVLSETLDMTNKYNCWIMAVGCRFSCPASMANRPMIEWTDCQNCGMYGGYWDSGLGDSNQPACAMLLGREVGSPSPSQAGPNYFVGCIFESYWGIAAVVNRGAEGCVWVNCKFANNSANQGYAFWGGGGDDPVGHTLIPIITQGDGVSLLTQYFYGCWFARNSSSLEGLDCSIYLDASGAILGDFLIDGCQFSMSDTTDAADGDVDSQTETCLAVIYVDSETPINNIVIRSCRAECGWARAALYINNAGATGNTGISGLTMMDNVWGTAERLIVCEDDITLSGAYIRETKWDNGATQYNWSYFTDGITFDDTPTTGTPNATVNTRAWIDLYGSNMGHYDLSATAISIQHALAVEADGANLTGRSEANRAPWSSFRARNNSQRDCVLANVGSDVLTSSVGNHGAVQIQSVKLRNANAPVALVCQKSTTSADGYFSIGGVAMGSGTAPNDHGFIMPCAGSIVGLTATGHASTASSPVCEIEVHKNGVAQLEVQRSGFGTGAQDFIGWQHPQIQVGAASPGDVFAAGDAIQLYFDYISGSITFDNMIGTIWVVFHDN